MAIFTLVIFAIFALITFADKLFNGKEADSRDMDSYYEHFGCFIIIGGIILTLLLSKACFH